MFCKGVVLTTKHRCTSFSSQERNLSKMTSKATEGQLPDAYGQLHPVETPQLVADCLRKFDEELVNLPSKDLKSVELAQENCPELLTDDFKLVFLRSEVFNADVSLSLVTQTCNGRGVDSTNDQ